MCEVTRASNVLFWQNFNDEEKRFITAIPDFLFSKSIVGVLGWVSWLSYWNIEFFFNSVVRFIFLISFILEFRWTKATLSDEIDEILSSIQFNTVKFHSLSIIFVQFSRYFFAKVVKKLRSVTEHYFEDFIHILLPHDSQIFKCYFCPLFQYLKLSVSATLMLLTNGLKCTFFILL